jgi:hypothetical protein
LANACSGVMPRGLRAGRGVFFAALLAVWATDVFAGDLAARFTGAAARLFVGLAAVFFATGFVASTFFAAALPADVLVLAFLVAACFVAPFLAAGVAALATLRAGVLAAVFFTAFPVAFFAVFFAVFFIADLRAWVAMPVSGRNDVIAQMASIAPCGLDNTPDIQAG